MTWQEICRQYPERWVLVEALDAFTENGQRITPTFQLVGDFGADWTSAWDSYTRLHHADQFREYYVLYTTQETLNIGVIDSFGRVLG